MGWASPFTGPTGPLGQQPTRETPSTPYVQAAPALILAGCYTVSCFFFVFLQYFSLGFGELTEEATLGLVNFVNRRLHSLEAQHREAVVLYSQVASMDTHSMKIPEDIDEWDNDGLSDLDMPEADDIEEWAGLSGLESEEEDV